MRSFLERLQREPTLITGLLIAVFNLFAVDQATSNSVVSIVSAAIPLLAALILRQAVTPVASPQLGTGEPPEHFLIAAQVVEHLLPLPAKALWAKYGAEGAWALVEMAQKAAKRPLTPQEGEAALEDQIARRAK